MERREVRWNSAERVSPPHVASWLKEAWKGCFSEDSFLLRMSVAAASLLLLAIRLNQGRTDKNNLKTFTSLELWICEMLFLVYKLTKLQFVLSFVFGFLGGFSVCLFVWCCCFLIPVLCSWQTLCRVVRSAVTFPTNSLAVHVNSWITFISFWSRPSHPHPATHVQFHFSHLQNALRVLIFNVSN